jgi:hypothetical protein
VGQAGESDNSIYFTYKFGYELFISKNSKKQIIYFCFLNHHLEDLSLLKLNRGLASIKAI